MPGHRSELSASRCRLLKAGKEYGWAYGSGRDASQERDGHFLFRGSRRLFEMAFELRPGKVMELVGGVGVGVTRCILERRLSPHITKDS